MGDFHKPIAPALFRRLDDVAPQAIECLRGGLGHGPGGYEGYETLDAQFHGLFHQPLLPVPFWKGYPQCDRCRQLAVHLVPGKDG